MNALIVIGASHSLYLSFLIFKREKKTLADNLLMLLFLTFGIEFSLLFSSFEFNLELLSLPLINSELLVIPIFYLYTRCITKPQRGLYKKDSLVFIPYALSSIYWITLFLSTNEYDLIQLFYHTTLQNQPFHFVFFKSLIGLLYPLFLLFILFQQNKHQKMILKNFSYTEGINYRWIKLLTIITLLEWMISHFYYFISGTDINNEHSLQTSAIFSTIFIFIIGYYGLKQGYFLSNKDDVNLNEPTKNVKDKSSISDSEAIYYTEKLESFMNKDKIYLNNTLSLSDLADSSGMSRNTLSWVINEKLNSNFYSYVNAYRIEEFKKIAITPQYENFTILAIAIECGFNSKATFNRIFKLSTGMTPNQYIKSIKND